MERERECVHVHVWGVCVCVGCVCMCGMCVRTMHVVIDLLVLRKVGVVGAVAQPQDHLKI